MATTQELDDLTQHVRRMLPDLKQLSNLRHNVEAGVLEFTWHARQFVVMTTLKVFELKGQSLMLTCSSMLMQAALHSKDRNFKVVTQVIDSLRSAEELMKNEQHKGLALLGQVRKVLLKLAGKQDPNAAHPARALARS